MKIRKRVLVGVASLMMSGCVLTSINLSNVQKGYDVSEKENKKFCSNYINVCYVYIINKRV